MSYLTKNDILSQSQFGFRANHSSHMALIELYNKITTAIDKDEFSIGIFIDLSKAFDTINHHILLTKLAHYGIRGISLKWFTSYLENRKQYVSVNGTDSSLSATVCGVPQGSILGPLLFLLYINDIMNCSDLLYFILFADDTNLFYSSKDLLLLQNTVICDLAKLAIWFTVNRLSLNVKKTTYVLFGSKRSIRDVKIKIDDTDLAKADSAKFLGVFIDSKLTWRHHINHIASKIAKGIGALNKVKHMLPIHVKTLIYRTMIVTHLTYCNIVWGFACKTLLNRLRLLQKRALRLLTLSHYLTPTSPLFRNLNLLKLDDMHCLEVAKFMFNVKMRLSPQIVLLNFTVIDLTLQKYNTRSKNYFLVPHYRTNLRLSSINISGPILWNSLPICIQDSLTIGVLKRNYTALLFSQYPV